MNHLVFGVVAILAGLCGVFAWWDDFGRVLRGVMPLALIVVGLVAIGAGLTSRRKRRPEPAPELGPHRVGIDGALRRTPVSVEK